ncbi:hypothetical protein [Xenophilus azovorans]|nr:hypothetical protein [Xenophilus azovorans]
MNHHLPRAVVRYFATRPLLVAFIAIGLADTAGKAAVAALGIA